MAGLVDILFPAIARNKRLQEEHELNKEIATLKSKLVNAQLEEGERKLRAQLAMGALINRRETQDVEMPAAGQMFADAGDGSDVAPVGPVTRTVAKPPSLRELATALIQYDPKAGTDLIEKDETIKQKNRELDLRAEHQKAMMPLLQRMMGGGGGGAGAAVSGMAAPGGGAPEPTMTGPGEATLGAVATGPPGGSPGGPQLTFKPTLNLDKDGNMSVSIAGERTQFQLQHQDVTLPDGRTQKVEIVYDPTSGRVVNRYPLGQPASPEFMRKAEEVVKGLGVERGSPLFARMVTEVLASAGLPPEDQAQTLRSMQGIAARARGRGQGAGAPMGSEERLDIGAAMDAADARRTRQAASQAAASTGAKIATERAEDAPTGTEAQRLNMLKSAERQADQIKALYRPEFVGKGFTAYRDRLKKDVETQAAAAAKGQYTPGAIAGAIREFVGTAAPGEVEFRRSVNDVADSILRARSGAQINEQEFRRMIAMLFSVFDEPATFVAGLDRFRAEVGRMIDDTLKAPTQSRTQMLRERQGGGAASVPFTTPDRVFDWDETNKRLMPLKPR